MNSDCGNVKFDLLLDTVLHNSFMHSALADKHTKYAAPSDGSRTNPTCNLCIMHVSRACSRYRIMIPDHFLHGGACVVVCLVEPRSTQIILIPNLY